MIVESTIQDEKGQLPFNKSNICLLSYFTAFLAGECQKDVQIICLPNL